MATIIVRTNPDKAANGQWWRCSQCRKYFVDPDKARTCAEKDYRKRTGRNPRKRVAA
jgi:hypothetical protein